MARNSQIGIVAHPILNEIVAIVSPDPRNLGTLSYELETHEYWKGCLQKKHIFLVPRNYRGVSSGAKSDPVYASEAACIEDLKGIWGGSTPIFTFTALEALVVIRQLLDHSYVVLTRKGSSRSRRYGYLIRFEDWISIRSSYLDRPESTVSELHHVDLCRALRIEESNVGAGVETAARVVDKVKLAKFGSRLFRVGTWQKTMWANSVGQIPDSQIADFRLLPSPLKARTIEGLTAGFDRTTKERLYFYLRFNAWEADNEKLLNRSEEVAKAFGTQPDPPGNFSNKLRRAGLINPSASIAKELFKQLRNEAKAYIKEEGEDKILADIGGHPFADERVLKPLLAILFPVDFGDELERERLGMPMWDFASA